MADDSIDRLDVLDLIADLVDRSLVRHDPLDGMSRYRLLDSLRAYAAEKLVEAGEEAPARRRHLLSTAAFLERVRLRGAEAGLWLPRLRAEVHDVRTSVDFAVAAGDAEAMAAAATIVAALPRFWSGAGMLQEGVEMCDRVLACTLAPADAARVRLAEGWLALVMTDIERSRAALEAGIERAREAGAQIVLAQLLSTLGILSWNFDHTAEALVPYEEAMAIFEAAGDPWGLADTTYTSGLIAWQGQNDLDLGSERIERGVALFEQLGDVATATDCRTCIGALALQRGDTARSQEVYEQCVADARVLGDLALLVNALGAAGVVASWGGDHAAARRWLVECEELAAQTGLDMMAVTAAIKLGRLDIAEGRAEEGVRRIALFIERVEPSALFSSASLPCSQPPTRRLPEAS